MDSNSRFLPGASLKVDQGLPSASSTDLRALSRLLAM